VERDEGRFAGNSRGKGRTNRNSVGGNRGRLVSVRRQRKHSKIAGFRVVIPPRTPWNSALENF